MDFANLFTLFTKSGMQQDPETHKFSAGIAEMTRLVHSIQEQREDDIFFNTFNKQNNEDF